MLITRHQNRLAGLGWTVRSSNDLTAEIIHLTKSNFISSVQIFFPHLFLYCLLVTVVFICAILPFVSIFISITLHCITLRYIGAPVYKRLTSVIFCIISCWSVSSSAFNWITKFVIQSSQMFMSPIAFTSEDTTLFGLNLGLNANQNKFSHCCLWCSCWSWRRSRRRITIVWLVECYKLTLNIFNVGQLARLLNFKFVVPFNDIVINRFGTLWKLEWELCKMILKIMREK